LDPSRSTDGADVTDPSPRAGRWIIVRQGPLAPEERTVLAALQRRLVEERREMVTVLLGTSSYDAERGPAATGEVWLLEEDARGRGIRGVDRPSVRVVTVEELATALMEAEKVTQFA
jgi:hypothetical protein